MNYSIIERTSNTHAMYGWIIINSRQEHLAGISEQFPKDDLEELKEYLENQERKPYLIHAYAARRGHAPDSYNAKIGSICFADNITGLDFLIGMYVKSNSNTDVSDPKLFDILCKGLNCSNPYGDRNTWIHL